MGVVSVPSARFALREATSADHAQVDGLFSGFDLADRAHYAAFLRAQADAFCPVEQAIGQVDLSAILPDWPDRVRAPALLADLAELGGAGKLSTSPPVYSSGEAALGAIYVLEGSRLGGQILARSVPVDWPRRFLNAGDPRLWRSLVGVLDRTLTSKRQLATAIEAARTVFARFGESARTYQKELRS